MPIILHIESSSNICSIALTKGRELIDLQETIEAKSHASLVTVFIEKMGHNTNISPQQLNAISVSKGPGSYTGLRIGVSVAKGMCYALNLPLIAINTLQAMAQSVQNQFKQDKNIILCPMIDARRMDVYCQLFDGKMNPIGETRAITINENTFEELLKKNTMAFFGDGAQKCKTLFSHRNAIFIDDFQLSAKNLIQLSYESYGKKQFENIAYFEPFYLKNFVPTTSKKQIHLP